MHVNSFIRMHAKIIIGSDYMYLKRLKDLREDHDLSQKEIASILKITRQQYSLYELGKRSLPIDLLITLADFYKTSTDYILDRINKK